MSGIDGTELLKILKEDSVTCEIPVIALTAHAMRGDEETFLEAGFSGYVSKPIDIQRFKSIIAGFIESENREQGYYFCFIGTIKCQIFSEISLGKNRMIC